MIEITEDNIKSASRLYYASDAYDSSSSTPAMSDATVNGYGNSVFDDVSTVNIFKYQRQYNFYTIIHMH